MRENNTIYMYIILSCVFIDYYFFFVFRPLNQGLESASNSLVHAAISPTLEGISGKYLEKCRDTPPCRWVTSPFIPISFFYDFENKYAYYELL